MTSLVRGHAVIVNKPHVKKSIHVNLQPNWSEHTIGLLPFYLSKDPLGTSKHEMTHHAVFLLGLHCLPNYIFKCERWFEA